MLLIIGATSVFVYPDPQTTLSPYEDPFYPSTDGPFELAQQILSLLEASHDQVSASLDGLVDEGVVIPEGAEDVFRMGEEAMALAYYYMDGGDYGSAIEKATEALQLFGESLQIALEAQQETAADEDEVTMSIVELRVQMEREYSRLYEFYETLRQLEETLLDVSDLQFLQFMQTNFLLEKADEYLDSASALLEEGDLEAVEFELATADIFLDEAFKLLQTISDSEKSKKASRFAEKNDIWLVRLEDIVSDMFGEEAYVELNATVVQETLENAKNVNKAVKILIESGEIGSTTDDLEKATVYSDDVVEMIEGINEDVAKILKNIERLEAKKSNLEAKIERLGSKDHDTTMFEEQLASVNEELLYIEELLNDDATEEKPTTEEQPTTEEKPTTEEQPTTEEKPTTDEPYTTDRKGNEGDQGENDQGEDDQGEDN
jgi:hypothetical protein